MDQGGAGNQPGRWVATGRQRLLHPFDPFLSAIAHAPHFVLHAKDVILSPHDPFRLSGRASGVEEHEIVGAPPPRGDGPPRWRIGARGLLEGGGPRRRGTGPIGHAEPATHAREPVTDFLDAIGETHIEDDGLDVGVEPERHEFIGPIAKVGVHRNQRRLEAGEDALDVLGTAVEILGDLRLMPETAAKEEISDTVGPLVESPPRDAAGSLNEAVGLRLQCCDAFPHVGNHPLGHGASPPHGDA